MCIRDRNMTNGVTFRRWLYKANPELSNLICEAIGDGWIKDYRELEKLTPFEMCIRDRSYYDECILSNDKNASSFSCACCNKIWNLCGSKRAVRFLCADALFASAHFFYSHLHYIFPRGQIMSISANIIMIWI